MLTSADFLPLIPELFLLTAACALLLVDLFLSAERRGLIHFLSLAILVLTLLGVTWIAARIYRIGILMYGKRPTLPELIRWIRTA